MAENEPTKICPLCAETIKAAAKVCPHCKHWQRSKWTFTNPAMTQTVTGLIIAAAMIIGFISLVNFLGKLTGPKRDFALYQNQIKVVSSEVDFQFLGAGSNLTMYVVGVVTNETAFSWKRIQLEAQMFDTNGALVDVIQAKDSSYGGVEIMPHAEVAFKIQGQPVKRQSEYATHKVAVVTGTDFLTWP